MLGPPLLSTSAGGHVAHRPSEEQARDGLRSSGRRLRQGAGRVWIEDRMQRVVRVCGFGHQLSLELCGLRRPNRTGRAAQPRGEADVVGGLTKTRDAAMSPSRESAEQNVVERRVDMASSHGASDRSVCLQHGRAKDNRRASWQHRGYPEVHLLLERMVDDEGREAPTCVGGLQLQSLWIIPAAAAG